MAYLGAQPNKTLTKTTSQSFNGTGSATAFTLNRAVNTEEELEVFVENVQQEPGSGKSYTASGTTLTFDEAPPSGTGNVYVIYRGLAEVTTRLEHDANAALAATTGTFTGAFTSPGIDDNASATAITIDSSGRVGIGATNMDESLLIQQTASGANTDVTIRSANDGNSRINFGDQSSDGSGRIDYDHTSNYMAVTTNSSERLRINSNGFVGIGYTASASDWSAAMKVHIEGSKGLTVKSTGGSSEEVMAVWNTGTSGTRYQIYFADGAGSVRGSISTNGSSTSYNTSSDYRLKENVTDMTGAITRVKQLAPKRFNFIDDPDDTTVDGFLAHEAQTVVPEAVVGTHNEVDDDGNAVMQSIDQAKLVPLLTAALKESIAKIETLEAKVAALEGN